MQSKRSIRSFANRQGRLTQGQQDALSTLWPKYGVDFDGEQPIELQSLFMDSQPIVLDIGFGNGISLLEMAKAMPEYNFIGIEVYQAGLGQLMRKADEAGLDNIKVFLFDANDVLAKLPENSIHRVQVYFPDPWPKKRHHKRRLVQPEFIAAATRVITVGGFMHCATDWQHYAEHMLTVLNNNSQLSNQAGDGQDYIPRPDFRPLTKFEARGERLGHGIWDLMFKKS